ncbi:MAG: cupredoxin domain-containing protein [Actinomycetota bacterium]|nr:cupredoxin domain-containing protein [Actinomycetota bacterium]
MRISARATLIPLVLFGLAACSDDSESSSTDSPTTAAPGESTPTAPSGGVTIAGFGFNTGDGVTAGEAFTITNDDPASHTFTDVGGAFSVSLSGGQEVTLTVDEPGTYEVVCQIHSSMSGTLTVN